MIRILVNGSNEAKTEGNTQKILDDLGITINDINQTNQADE